MYKITNGILEKQGKKIFALGQSYYPSFHKYKYPVPPEGDRMGEMKKDFAMMKEMGFNHIRIAAIGTTKLGDDGKLIIDTPFVDAMIDEAEKIGISISIRLQGYVVNLRDFKDVLMIDADGNPQDTSVWFDFINSTLCHEGILEDNRTLSAQLSAYYAKKESVVGFQIYNEPHYPGRTFYDYHPSAIAAYRKWLIDNKIMTAKEAESYEPPRSRKEQGARMWALWRLFSQKCMTDFLENAAAPAVEASGKPAFTCLTNCTLLTASPYRGVDVFENARSSMEILGYTCYLHGAGAEYYTMNLWVDIAANAALSEGREAWCIELDSRTYIPCDIFNKNTYAALGSGIKGLVYYQWRGDYPSPATPIPNGCGLLNYDGSKVENFDNADKMVKFINRMSDYLIGAKRANDKVGVFHSNYAAFMSDAVDNTDEKRSGETLANSYMAVYKEMYAELRKKGYTVGIADAKALCKNTLGIETLFVANSTLLSDEEKEVIEEFIRKGGRVFENVSLTVPDINADAAYVPYGTEVGVYTLFYTIDELCAQVLASPLAVSSNPLVPSQTLVGDDYMMVVLTNITCSNQKQALELTVNKKISKAILCTPDGDSELEISGGKIIVKKLGDGGIVIVK